MELQFKNIKVLSHYFSVAIELKCHKGMLTVRVETKVAEIKESETTRASKLCTLTPNVCGCSVCNFASCRLSGA